MEFACELLRLDDCVVDQVTQAVFADGELVAADVSWLHPRGESLDTPPVPTSFVERGVLAPMTGGWNVFYLLLELAAGLSVADRGGVLAGSSLVGWLPEGADPRLPEAAALYGCAAQPRPGQAGRYARVGALFVPRFWIRAAGSEESHFDAPRWAAAGYSREILADLRSRLLPVPAPEPTVVAYGRGPAADAEVPVSDTELVACHDAGAAVLPRLSTLGLADQAALHARVRALVAIHGEANVNIVFLPDGATVDEVFVSDETPGQFALLADLRGLDYAATVVESADRADVGRLIARRARDGAPSDAAVYILTGVWDNADLLDDWLGHHQGLGIAGVMAMDFGSTDGSLEILRSSRWSSFVVMVDFPGITPNHSRLLIEAARSRWPQGWALMIDPDEFLFTATADVHDPLLRGAMAAAPAAVIPRFELTTLRSVASAGGPERPGLEDLSLRVVEQDQGKVVVDLASDCVPSRSTHKVYGAGNPTELAPTDVMLLHAPVRSFARFEQKVEHAAYTISQSPFLDEGHAWHWRRWIAIRDEGGLWDEYLEQFVADADVPGLLADGALAEEHRLARAVRAVRATGRL